MALSRHESEQKNGTSFVSVIWNTIRSVKDLFLRIPSKTSVDKFCLSSSAIIKNNDSSFRMNDLINRLIFWQFHFQRRNFRNKSVDCYLYSIQLLRGIFLSANLIEIEKFFLFVCLRLENRKKYFLSRAKENLKKIFLNEFKWVYFWMFLSFGSVLVASLSRDGWNRMKKGDFESPLCTHSLWQDTKLQWNQRLKSKSSRRAKGWNFESKEFHWKRWFCHTWVTLIYLFVSPVNTLI